MKKSFSILLWPVILLVLAGVLQAEITVDYMAQPGMPRVEAPNGAPLPVGNRVRLGAFPDGYAPNAHGPLSWGQNWIPFDEALVGGSTGRLGAGRFSRTASGSGDLVSGRKPYWFVFQTVNAEAPADGFANVTALGLFSSTASDWVFPPDDFANYALLTSTQVDQAYGGASISEALVLETYAAPPGAYQIWATSHGLTGPDAEPGADPMNDGISNLLKFAFNLDPTQSSPPDMTPGSGKAGLPSISRSVEAGGQESLRVEYVRRRDGTVIYTARRSSTLAGSWTPLSSVPTVTVIDTEWERVLYQEPLAGLDAQRQFANVLLAFAP